MTKHSQLGILKLELDPCVFMKEAFGAVADPWQASLLRNTPAKSLLLCSRQSGKSTVSAVIALYNAVFNSGALVLIVAKARRQALELFRKVREGLKLVLDLGIVSILYETQSSIEFSNGSRIVAIPGKQDTIRGYSRVSFLLLDEAAFIPDDVYAAVRPMLAVSKGKIIAMTTPYGKRGWFFRAWDSSADWTRISVTASECPRISEAFLNDEIEEIGEWRVRQEYMCEFIDAEDQLFSYDDLMKAITDDVIAWERRELLCMV